MSLYQSDELKPDAKSKEILKEMGDDPAQKLSQLEVLRSWIVSHPYMQCRTDDEFLLRYLRVSKFSCEKAKERLLKFCVTRSSKLDGIPEWFANQNMRDDTLRDVISRGGLYLMPKPDKLGRLVIVFEMERAMTKKVDPELFIRSMYMFIDWVIHTFERSQINGVVFIEAGNNSFDPEHMKYWTLEKMKKNMDTWQGGMPVRMKMVHYYNMPALIKPLIETCLKFAKPKLAKRLTFHSDLKLDADIPPECMPRCLGGTGPAWEDIRDDMLREMDKFQSEFDSFKMCKVDDAKMPKTYAEGDSWGISGTYRAIAKDD